MIMSIEEFMDMSTVSSSDDEQTANRGSRKASPRGANPKQKMTESTLNEALEFGDKNAFLTRRTWHKNVGNDDTAGAKVADTKQPSTDEEET